MLFRALLLIALFGLTSVPSFAESEKGKLTSDQITDLYKRFESTLRFDVKRHNQMVKFREQNRDRLLAWVSKSLNLSGYRGDSLRDAFDLAAKKRPKAYTDPVNKERYQFVVRLPESLIRQCKPYGEELYGSSARADVYVKLIYNDKVLYENSLKTTMPSHYNCTMRASDRDMEKILVDGLRPERLSAVPYWLESFEMEDFNRYNSHLWNAVERVLVSSPGLFVAKTEQERIELVNEARAALLIQLQPTRESFFALVESLRFPVDKLRGS